MTDRELTFLLQKYETFEREVLSPAVYKRLAPFNVEWCTVDRDLRASEAAALAFAPVELGFRWGPAWQRGWFRLRSDAPTGGTTVVRFDCGTEALLFDGDRPWHGFDVNRDAAPLPRSTKGEGLIELLIEAECMHPWGVRAFTWDMSETHKRWGSDDPGHLTLAELATFNEEAWRLETAFRFARQLLAEAGLRSTTGRLCQSAIERSLRVIDDHDVASTATAALSELSTALAAGADAGASHATAIGHAHIDTAWLWTLNHTHRKCQRSWANMLRLMERFEDVSFLCSQAAQYAMVERDAPAQFEEISKRVNEGRWEPFGSMWVEPDCNVPSGESLIRQIVYGCAYWSSRFGPDVGHGVCFLPDTFGFPATLPTILRACGVHTFITNKLSWNQTNPMPHTSFDWIGPDGSSVVAHLTPGGDYNATNSPRELIKGETVGLAAPPAERWLQPFGFGDGGGGPTDRHIENARLANSCPSLPRVTLSSAASFVVNLHRDRDVAIDRNEPWPSWRGDLYLELHRGTFTTQRRLKQLNFAAEEALREAEILACIESSHDRSAFDDLWRTLLTNQFHDILPGSSITEVNEQAVRELDDVCTRSASVVPCEAEDPSKAETVWNPASSSATGVVRQGDRLILVRDAQPLSAAIAISGTSAQRVNATRSTLDNGRVAAEFNDAGEIVSLRGPGGTQLVETPLQHYRLFRDRPHLWDAWDIDPGYERDEIESDSNAQVDLVQDEPLRCVIQASRAIGTSSHIVTRYVLDAESPVLRIEVDVEWHESHRLLRVDYPTTVRTGSAVAGTQFGWCERPTHRNTSWDCARFEFPAHRFVSLGTPGAGLAVIASDLHGWSCEHSTIGASLLRSPVHPDPEADRGSHRFVLGLYPHSGDWRTAGVSSTAERFARPMRTVRRTECAPPLSWDVEGTACLELSALMPDADHNDSIVARFIEVEGGEGWLRLSAPGGIRSVARTDALGRELAATAPPDEAISIAPHQITTLRIEFDR